MTKVVTQTRLNVNVYVHCLLVSYSLFSTLNFTLVRPKLEYASPVWNNITTSVTDKVESIQIRSAALCSSVSCFLVFLVVRLMHLTF